MSEIECFENIDDLREIEECPECNSNVFKYFNTTNRNYYVKCSNVKYLCDINVKNKQVNWKKNKKHCSWTGKVVFKLNEKIEYAKNTTIFIPPPPPPKENKNKLLENRLKELFSYLKVSKNQSALQEINLLVETKLKKPLVANTILLPLDLS